jgi:biofilm PGA synthesis N-glycosyltransferase PgaC
VIVVNDGSKDKTMDVLRSRFRLEPCTWHPPARTLETRLIRNVYRSAVDPRVIVVDKANGGKADALNCGTNVARERYVVGVDADTVLSDVALARGMEPFDDPHVVGLTSYLSITRSPRKARFQRGVKLVDRSPLISFQHLDYVRSFHNSRLAWTRLNYMLCTNGAFQVWRRDVLVELGGFSRDFTCEDIEWTFRVHEHFRRNKLPYRVVCIPDEVGATEGPQKARSLIAQRARWQRVILETFWHYRRMFGNPRYGTVGLLGMPFYLISEVLAPVFEQLAIAMLPLAIVADRLSWRAALLFSGAIALSNGVITTGSLLIADQGDRSYRKRDLARLVLLAPTELFWYRPILTWARIKGTWGYVRGDRGWDKFERNVTPQAAAVNPHEGVQKSPESVQPSLAPASV